MNPKPLVFPLPLPPEQEKQPWCHDLYALQGAWYFPVLESGTVGGWQQALLVFRLIPNRALVRGLMLEALGQPGAVGGEMASPQTEFVWGVTVAVDWGKMAVVSILNATRVPFDPTKLESSKDLTRGETVDLTPQQEQGLKAVFDNLLGPQGALGEAIRATLGPLLPDILRPPFNPQGLENGLKKSSEKLVGYRTLYPEALPLLFVDPNGVTYCLEDYYPWGRGPREVVCLVVKQDVALGQMVKQDLLTWDWARKKVGRPSQEGGESPQEWFDRFSSQWHTPLEEVLTGRARWLAQISKNEGLRGS